MANKASNDVFLSYRRDVAGFVALALFQGLSQQDIDAFYDINSMREAGQFGSIILRQIEARPYFILLLTPGTLERCSEPQDWLRQEIEHAVAIDRVIIPAHTPDFDFHDLDRCLPEELGHTVRGYQAQELPHKWFEAAVQRLVTYLRPIELSTTATPATDKQMVERIRQQAEAAPTVTSKQLSAQEHVELGLIRYQKGDLGGAISKFEEAMRLDPEYARAFYYRGFVRHGKHDLDRAIADYSEAIDLDPQLVDVFLNRGSARGGKGDFDGAIVDYDEAIRLNPENALALTNRGFARQRKGDFDGAIADYDEAIRLNPENALAFTNRGFRGS